MMPLERHSAPINYLIYGTRFPTWVGRFSRGKHPTPFSPPTTNLYLHCTRTGTQNIISHPLFLFFPPSPIEMCTRGTCSRWTLTAFGVIGKKDMVSELTKVHDDFSSER